MRPAALVICLAGFTAEIGAAAATPGAAHIVIKDFMFQPMTVTIEAGSVVRWTNGDDEPHNVVSDIGLFRSGALDTDDEFSYRFDRPGTYHFVCSIHPRMIGVVVVKRHQ